MTKTRTPGLGTMNNRQKVILIVFIAILAFLGWQVWALLKPTSRTTTTTTTVSRLAPGNMATNSPAGGGGPQQMFTPQPAPAPKAAPMTQREMQLMQLQQETEAKYVAALNELQMLKVEREIAENNKAIMTAKLDTVTAQKNIVDLLTKPAPQVSQAVYAQGLANPSMQQPPPPQTIAQPEVNYTVISVSELQYRWSAVVGYAGNLYNVHIGDILPPDRSKVIAIDKAGVILDKNGVRKRISLVPII